MTWGVNYVHDVVLVDAPECRGEGRGANEERSDEYKALDIVASDSLLSLRSSLPLTWLVY